MIGRDVSVIRALTLHKTQATTSHLNNHSNLWEGIWIWTNTNTQRSWSFLRFLM